MCWVHSLIPRGVFVGVIRDVLFWRCWALVGWTPFGPEGVVRTSTPLVLSKRSHCVV